MSLGGSFYAPLNEAVEQAVSRNVVVVVAGGNNVEFIDPANPCCSPATAPSGNDRNACQCNVCQWPFCDSAVGTITTCSSATVGYEQLYGTGALQMLMFKLFCVLAAVTVGAVDRNDNRVNSFFTSAW